MKCPKCGYNSFEYHDICTKCSHDLGGYKQSYGLKAIVLPLAARMAMAESLIAESAAENPAAEDVTVAAATDMFSFDLSEDEPTAARDTAPAERDPFSFIDEPAGAPSQGFGDFASDSGMQSEQAKAEEEAFASLLESTSHDGAGIGQEPGADIPLESASFDSTDVFADAFDTSTETASPTVPEPSAPAAGTGEFDLENFSWDDTPVSDTGDSTKPPENDFDTLFGDRDDTKK